jgi:hypothetical protein
MFLKSPWAGHVTQWYSTFLAYAKPWVPSSALPKKQTTTKLKRYILKYFWLKCGI